MKAKVERMKVNVGVYCLRDGRKVILRYVRISDLNEIYEIERLSFKYPYPYSLLYTLARTYQDTFIVAEHNGRVVGYVIASLREHGIGHILNIAVHPDYRRKGLGLILMNTIMNILKDKGARIFRLEVAVSNIPAKNLYEKLGFRVQCRIKDYYEDGEDCYVMMKYC